VPDSPAPTAFTALPDLASRQLGGSVVVANDELFAQRENLIKPEPSVFAVHEFGHKGKVYDGWETRRRREPGHDWAVVRLGAPGVVFGVVVDTSWFAGNYPPSISIEAARIDGYPAAAEVDGATWETLVDESAALGDTANTYAVDDDRVWTHVRLSIYPDGGVARFRVHGVVVPDVRFLTGTVDLAALENGGDLIGCSDAFPAEPDHAWSGPADGPRLGERPSARRRQRLRDLPACRRGGCRARRDRHVVLRGQRTGMRRAEWLLDR
jgi:allantoicase